MPKVKSMALQFHKKYPFSIAWRIPEHAKVIETHINPDEEAIFAFPGQLTSNIFNIFTTCVVCLTNKRIIIAQKKLFWGYHYTVITPDKFNDLSLRTKMIFGQVKIDTLKEEVNIYKLDKSSLAIIETKISSYMMEEKQKYASSETDK